MSHLYLHGIAQTKADDRPFLTAPPDRALKALPFDVLEHLIECLDRPFQAGVKGDRTQVAVKSAKQ